MPSPKFCQCIRKSLNTLNTIEFKLKIRIIWYIFVKKMNFFLNSNTCILLFSEGYEKKFSNCL